MKQKRFTVDQIIPKLREADVNLGKGKKVPEICKNDLPPVTVPVVKLLFAAPLGQPLHFVEA